jgi:hypothetical protein
MRYHCVEEPTTLQSSQVYGRQLAEHVPGFQPATKVSVDSRILYHAAASQLPRLGFRIMLRSTLIHSQDASANSTQRPLSRQHPPSLLFLSRKTLRPRPKTQCLLPRPHHLSRRRSLSWNPLRRLHRWIQPLRISKALRAGSRSCFQCDCGRPLMSPERRRILCGWHGHRYQRGLSEFECRETCRV